MRHRIVIVLLALGTIGGYASGFAHLRHGCHHGWRHHGPGHGYAQGYGHGHGWGHDCGAERIKPAVPAPESSPPAPGPGE